MVRVAPVSVMLLPLVILLLLAGIGIIVMFIKRSSNKRLLVGIIALVLVVVATSFVLMHGNAMHHWRRASMEWRRPGNMGMVSARRWASAHEVSVESRAPRSEETSVAIWVPGIEDEFEANVYPSELSAVRSLGLRIGDAVRRVFDTQRSPSRFVLFQGAHDRSLVQEFGETIARAFPGTQWSIEPETAGVQPDEVGVRLDLVKVETHPAPWIKDSESTVATGTVQASVMAAGRQSSIKADFTDKPWVEDFSRFLNARPNSRFIVARSTDSCMTESEANHQALDNACAQVTQMLSRISRRQSGVRRPLVSRVDSEDILGGNLILDRFVQSFQGSTGPIWRQALLIDGSTGKLEQLAHRKAIMAQAMKMNWARMFASVFGLLFLITVVYVFLNAATKGYYVWSLRIAGIVVAAVVIFLLLT
jgi:hypothetical protein